MEQLSLKVLEDDKETIYEIIAVYHDENTDKNFVIYTDKTLDENKKLNIYYSLYYLDDDKIMLIKTTSIEDKRIGLELIKEISKML